MSGFPRTWISSVAGGVGLAIVGMAFSAAAQDAAKDYAALSAEADSIQRHNAYLEKAFAAQLNEIGALEQQLAGLDATGAAFAELLPRMFAEFEAFVVADLPFLADERAQRVARLRDVFAQAETPTAEKYRRLMEAYQIEMDYGRSMEAYDGTLDGKGDVRFLRLGRVALMYAASDGSETGYWDVVQKTWVTDPDYNAGIQAAIRIAKQEVTADLVAVPVPAASQGR